MSNHAAGNRWEAVAAVDELGERQIRCVFVAGHPIVLVALDGEVYAVDGWCPHRDAWLWEGRLQGDSIRCPLHGFCYDVRSGESTWPGGWDPLRTYATRVDAGVVHVFVP
jgi:3-phenylpropionate/trans-cinnamate dioxygenase ferredoxin component